MGVGGSLGVGGSRLREIWPFSTFSQKILAFRKRFRYISPAMIPAASALFLISTTPVEYDADDFTLPTLKPMLAHTYEGQTIGGWRMGEKLDGVRATWDGEKLISRRGNVFATPSWFLAQLPAGIPLDGELWIGRGQFQKTVSTVKKSIPLDHEWALIRFRVFDAPQHRGGFETRLEFCASVLKNCAVASIIEHTLCMGQDHMEEFFESLIAEGAEGIVLRAPRSLYENRRSPKMLKYKPFDSDEATVIGHEPRALVVRWRGVEFKLSAGIPADVLAHPPAIGSAVSFSFCGVTDSGCPRCTTYLIERSYE